MNRDVGRMETRKHGPLPGPAAPAFRPCFPTRPCGWRPSLRAASRCPPALFPGKSPGPPLLRFWVRPLPGREVAPQVLEVERREVGAEPPADPPLALSRVPAPGPAELVPVVFSSDPPARRGQRAALAPDSPGCRAGLCLARSSQRPSP